jgi:hemolysin III
MTPYLNLSKNFMQPNYMTPVLYIKQRIKRLHRFNPFLREKFMSHAGTDVQQTFGEEFANTITHGIGAALSIAALVILVVRASLDGNAWQIVSLSIFGTSLIVLYMMSTLYHAARPGRIKRFFHLMDHASIYILIAGSYTPVLLSSMRGGWGWSLFGVIWGLAIVGVIFKVRFVGRYDIISTLLYIAMGWIIVIAAKPFITSVPTTAVIWLAIGGVTYTLGTIFYIWDRLPYNHTIWHLFVMGGSICHFFAFLFGLIPG